MAHSALTSPAVPSVATSTATTPQLGPRTRTSRRLGRRAQEQHLPNLIEGLLHASSADQNITKHTQDTTPTKDTGCPWGRRSRRWARRCRPWVGRRGRRSHSWRRPMSAGKCTSTWRSGGSERMQLRWLRMYIRTRMMTSGTSAQKSRNGMVPPRRERGARPWRIRSRGYAKEWRRCFRESRQQLHLMHARVQADRSASRGKLACVADSLDHPLCRAFAPCL